MQYEYFHFGKTYSFGGKEYILCSESTFGQGKLYSCAIFTFEPKHNKELPDISAMRWHDGVIERFKKVNQRKSLNYHF